MFRWIANLFAKQTAPVEDFAKLNASLMTGTAAMMQQFDSNRATR